VCDGKEKAALSLSFAAAALEEPLLSIPPADDGCDDQDEERSEGSNSLSNAGTEMNDISLNPSLLSRLPQESLTLLYSQRISVCLWLFAEILFGLLPLHPQSLRLQPVLLPSLFSFFHVLLNNLPHEKRICTVFATCFLLER
jgi:hypothetical protein